MTSSPLFYPLNRGMDAEAGGAADLQTDVMRFIAILSLCLVAIFALVQSIPLAPVQPDPAPAPTQSIDIPIADSQPVEARPPLPVEPARIIPDMPEPREIIEHRPPPATESQPAPPVPAAQPEEGFTLKFESDIALTRLVARGEIGLYAIAPDQALRMSVNRGDFSFWPASLPNQFHEMDGTTVPTNVVAALHRAGRVPAESVKWGVTLPSRMLKKLNQYISEHSGGALIIGGGGELRLEP